MNRKAIHRFNMLTLRQYQRTAVKSAVVHFAFNQRGLLVSPAGSGKTVIAASILKEVKAGRTLWLAPTVETKDQGRKACETVGVADVTCACFQGQPDLSGYEWVVVDEAHIAGCDTLQKMLDGYAGKVLSLTATPIRADSIDIEQIVGRCFYTVKRSDVMDAGGIVGASVWWVDVPGTIVEDVNRATSREVRSWMNDEQVNRVMFRHAKKLGIVANDWRNRKAAEMARRAIDKGRSVLVLVAEIEQGRGIVDLIGEGAVLAHSGMAKRADTLEDVKSGKIPCVVSTSLADQGLDLPILSVVIMACGGRAEGRTEQRVGRVMRVYEGKPESWVIDFRDSHHYFLQSQAKKRAMVYRKLGITDKKPA
jgi:superfamily II DNA or RNA helicase